MGLLLNGLLIFVLVLFIVLMVLNVAWKILKGFLVFVFWGYRVLSGKPDSKERECPHCGSKDPD